MFEDPSRIWDLDETALNAKYSRRARVLTKARSNLVGRRHKIKDRGIHVAAGIAASASDLFASVFFVAGKKVLPSWKKPINKTQNPRLPENLHLMTDPD